MEFLLEILTLLLVEEEESRRSDHLKYLRDSANPFEIEENNFRKYFRLPKSLANILISKLEVHNNQSSDIPFAFRVLSTLNFLGHGSYPKCVAVNYLMPMSQTTVSWNIGYVCSLITTKMANKITFCVDQDQKNFLKEGFYSKFGIKGVIGVIDCTHISIMAPSPNDPDRPAHVYMNNKGFYSINVEAIVDSNLKFLSVNAKYPGSVHDSAIWSTSPARIHLIQQFDARRYNWLLGDNGYPLEPWLLTPFSQPSGRQDKKFNEIHIRARSTVKRAFGVLKSRFRCLHKHSTLHFTPEKAALIIYSCVILHNMLHDCGYNDDEDLIFYDDEGEESVYNTESTDYLTKGRRIRNEYASTL